LDPNYARAYAFLSWAYYNEWHYQWTNDSAGLDRAIGAAEKAVALDDSLSEAHTVMGWLSLWKKQHGVSIAELERAVSLDPNDARAYAYLAETLNFAGRPDEAIGFAKRAMRLDPNYQPSIVFHLAHSYFLLRRYDEAIAAMRDALGRNPNFPPAHRMLAVTYAELGGRRRPAPKWQNYCASVRALRWTFGKRGTPTRIRPTDSDSSMDCERQG